MPQDWEPGTQYNYNDVVSYNGHDYKIIQPHRSQSDWAPDVTPALWGRMQGHHSSGAGAGGHHGQHEQKPWQAPQGDIPFDPNHQNDPNTNWNDHQKQTVEIQEHEKEKHWYDIPDDRKKELEVGGGLLAGAALLAGGYAAYRHHEAKGEEEEKSEAWAVQNWLQDAQRRQAEFFQRGSQETVTWVLTQDKQIPRGAIQCGEENGMALYSARAYCKQGVHAGKAFQSSNMGACISWGGKSIDIGTYEVLVGDQNRVRWVQTSGRLNVNNLEGRPVEAGFDSDGSKLYVARAFHNGATHPGKCSEKLQGCNFAWGDRELLEERYEVLCTV